MPDRQFGKVSHIASAGSAPGASTGEAFGDGAEVVARTSCALRQSGGKSHIACGGATEMVAMAATGADVTGIRSMVAVSAVKQPGP
jgi:hypothetical protein